MRYTERSIIRKIKFRCDKRDRIEELGVGVKKRIIMFLKAHRMQSNSETMLFWDYVDIRNSIKK